jgi:hypothetical protein
MKAKILRFAAELLVEMCKPNPGHGWCLDRNGLPLDAKLTGVMTDLNHERTIIVRVESEEWPDVENGFVPPLENDPVFRSIPQPGWTEPAAGQNISGRSM